MSFAASGVVTLTTDFGTKDPFVGVMKGVVLARFAAARIVDVTHEIGPQCVEEAAFWTARAYAWFPPGSVHVVVVDPGVGTARGILCVEAGTHVFLAPDNGVLGGVLEAEPAARVFVVEAPELLGSASATFHGRDVFAPLAAELAAGARSAASVGRAVERGAVIASALRAPVVGGSGELEGVVVTVDHFGNLITNVRARDLQGRTRVRIAGRELPIVRTYGDAGDGELVALVGSFDALELASVNGNAAKALGAKRGEPVTVV